MYVIVAVIVVPLSFTFILWSNLSKSTARTATASVPAPTVAAVTPPPYQQVRYQNAWIHIGDVTTSTDCPEPAVEGKEWRLVRIDVNLAYFKNGRPVDPTRWLVVKGPGDDEGIAPSAGLPETAGACPAALPLGPRTVPNPVYPSAAPVRIQSGWLAFEVPVGAYYPYLRYLAGDATKTPVWLNLSKP